MPGGPSRTPEAARLMFTSFSDDALLDSILAGAAGYVLKQVGGSEGPAMLPAPPV
jgi:two-component system, NarL family, response regulator DevR